ncbi:hypothetical protein OQA88_10214 [Cercophora sp. LCS_1]
MGYPTRPFWAGLDPDKPEPLNKVLAALHCYQVAAPRSNLYFEFTVDRKDHHRLTNGFLELQKLAALIHKEVFDSSTGKLATMSAHKAFIGLKFSTYHAIATGLDSISHLPAPTHRADNRPANITIPYTTIVSKLRQQHEYGRQAAKDTDGLAHTSGGNDFKAGGGKRSFSTLAGGNRAHKTVGSIPPSGAISGGGKRPLSAMSTVVGYHGIKGHNMLGFDGGMGS